MAITVEDGSDVTDANAYIPVSYADTYFSERGIATWTGATSVKEIAIIKATDYIEKVYGDKFLGYKNLDTQSLSWPRNGQDETTGLPKALKQATAEYALRALSAALMADPSYDSTGKLITALRTKVGPIEKDITYSEAQGFTIVKAYPAADMLLRSLIYAGGRVIR